MAEPTEYISNIMNVEELLSLWPGVTEDTLSGMIQDKSLRAYSLVRKLMNNGTPLYECKRDGQPDRVRQGRLWILRDWNRIVFNASDINMLVAQNPHFKCPHAVPPESVNNDSPAQEYSSQAKPSDDSAHTSRHREPAIATGVAIAGKGKSSIPKSPEELLLLHEREPQRWTLKALYEEYYPSLPENTKSAKKAWITRQLKKAKQARNGK